MNTCIIPLRIRFIFQKDKTAKSASDLLEAHTARLSTAWKQIDVENPDPSHIDGETTPIKYS